MSLDYGTKPDTPAGMTLTVYTEIDSQLSPPLKDAINNAQSANEKKAAEDALKDARETWKKLSYAVAKGVIEHIMTNMEIRGIETQGNVNTTVEGKTDRADPGNHQHDVDLLGEQIDVVFTQSNDGTGRVK
ncbi:MAG: hypothetical protein IMF03_05795 [Proteobacteria bacterium]|nr:hypothetical protein [Pseudomonadota bacterium]